MVEEAHMNDCKGLQNATDEKALLTAQSLEESRLLTLPQVQAPSHLQLDPTARRRPPGHILNAKFICVLLAFVVAFSAARIHVQYDVRVLYKKYSAHSHPHLSNYYHPEPGKVPTGDEFLKPLIGRRGELGGVFDLRATVWVRVQDEAQVMRGLPTRETVIFTDTVFKGVTLQDKRLREQIELRIPTRLLQNTVLKETDLRASFVLVPRSPSLLDDAVGISTINNENIDGRRRVRSYAPTYSPTLQDNIVDSYGISTPLLGFYSMQHLCNSSDGMASSVSSSTAHHMVLQRHPHIISRTFLTVADTTMLYDAQRYDKLQRLLRQAKYRCRDEDLGPAVCTRNFPIHGVFETKFRYRKDDGKRLNEGWAYAPFMSVINNTWGPLDLIPAPVDSDVCPPVKGSSPLHGSQDDSFINVTWHITYSGRTPFKLAYTNVLSSTTPYNASITAEEKIVMQFLTAGKQGMIGHPFRDDDHPRRRAILDFVATKCASFNTLVTFNYFLTLSTTAGLSTLGTILRASSSLLDRFISEAVRAYHRGGSVSSFITGIWGALIAAGLQMTAILMLKAVLKASFQWDRGGITKLIPRICIYPPTRRERASQRLESRISWSMIIGAFCFLNIAQYLIPFSDLYIIQPRNMAAPRKLLLLESHHLYIVTYLLNPVDIIATLLQLVHNHRSKTFAGNHKVAVGALMLSVLSRIASDSPVVVGYMDVHAGYSVGSLLWLILRLTIGFQACIFPAVSQTGDSEDEE